MKCICFIDRSLRVLYLARLPVPLTNKPSVHQLVLQMDFHWVLRHTQLTEKTFRCGFWCGFVFSFVNMSIPLRPPWPSCRFMTAWANHRCFMSFNGFHLCTDPTCHNCTLTYNLYGVYVYKHIHIISKYISYTHIISYHIYIYSFTCIYVCIYIYIYVYIYFFKNISINLHIAMCTYIYMYIPGSPGSLVLMKRMYFEVVACVNIKIRPFV